MGSLARPPGPSRWEVLKTLPQLRRDPIRTLAQFRERFGDVSLLRLIGRTGYYVQDPVLIEQLLLKDAGSYQKDVLLRQIKLLLGEGLLTSEGDFWRRQRKLASPFLTRKQVERYGEVMRELALDYVRNLPHSAERDVHKEVMGLTLDIVSRTLFGSDLNVDPSRVGHCLDVVMDYFFRVSRSLRRLIPRWVPNRDNRNATAAVRELNEIVYAIIEQRRAEGAVGDDLLSRLLAVRDEDGARMSDMQVRDEVITLFIAGHETTALALANTLWLMSENPDAEARLREEIASVGPELSSHALEGLPYLDAVLKESMRLKPPAWSVAREARANTTLGEWYVPRGTQIYVSQYLIQRDPRFFEAPEDFRPERWLDGSCDELPRFAYFPFGGGPRVCIGNHFAIMELKILLVTLLQHARFQHREGHEVSFVPSVTLRPRNGMPMRIERLRAPEARAVAS